MAKNTIGPFVEKPLEKVRIQDLVNASELRRNMTVKTIPGVDVDVALTPKGLEIRARFRRIAVGEYTAEYIEGLPCPLIEFLDKEAADVIRFCLVSAKEDIEAILKDLEQT